MAGKDIKVNNFCHVLRQQQTFCDYELICR